MRFTSNAWVYRDVLIRPGTPFESPSKLSDTWTAVGGDKEPEIVTAIDEQADKPRRGRPPKVE